MRAFTGTIPDYTAEVEGLKLAGVIAGGPAEEAGLAEGDVIVQFGERKIANIYDYTYALEAVKVGVPLEVVYLRGGERRETTSRRGRGRSPGGSSPASADTPDRRPSRALTATEVHRAADERPAPVTRPLARRRLDLSRASADTPGSPPRCSACCRSPPRRWSASFR